jgi:hypothetical protein
MGVSNNPGRCYPCTLEACMRPVPSKGLYFVDQFLPLSSPSCCPALPMCCTPDKIIYYFVRSLLKTRSCKEGILCDCAKFLSSKNEACMDMCSIIVNDMFHLSNLVQLVFSQFKVQHQFTTIHMSSNIMQCSVRHLPCYCLSSCMDHSAAAKTRKMVQLKLDFHKRNDLEKVFHVFSLR